MILNEHILYEYAKAIKGLVANSTCSEVVKNSVLQTLNALLRPSHFYTGDSLKCYNGMVEWLLEARTNSEAGLENSVPSLDRAIDCYNYYNKGVEI